MSLAAVRRFSVLLAVTAAASSLAACQTTAGKADNPGTVARTATAGHAVYPEVTLAQWLAELRREALASGIRAATFDAAFANVRLSDRVSELDASQPEFTRQVWNYLDSAVSDDRVRNGRDRLNRNATLLQKVERQYGVPAEILVAFWGVETDFGASPGNFAIIDSLTTLSFRGRRTEYFRSELLAALRILDNGDITLDRLRGSWAGAMGQTQFMPSLYLKNAIDADGDGKRDIWNSLPDIFASTANDVRADGWRAGERWGEEVRLPSGFPYQDAELNVVKPVSEWRRLGVIPYAGGVLAGDEPASVLILAGHRGPAFLVKENYRAIMRYNPSTSYALAVAVLSDRIAGRPGIRGGWPREEAPLSHDDKIDLQQRLERMGFAPGKVDGIVSANTRAAVRLFQQKIGEIPDGFATHDLLAKLRMATGG